MTALLITLKPEEHELLDRIEFDAALLVGNHARYRGNADAVAKLSTNLFKRSAIPHGRLRYFTDPDCNPGGRGKSRKQIFERNGTEGHAILEHPHFLRYLHYFLYGADLPPEVVLQFQNEVKVCEPVTSGDLAPLADRARRLVRAHGLEPRRAADEFIKLALDCGLSPFFAEHIRDAVRGIR